MLAKEIISESYVTTPEVKEILAKRAKQDELRYEQRTTLEYATRFSRTTAKEARRVVEQLLKEVEGLKEHQAVLIVNLLPIDRLDLQLIFAKERLRLDDAKIDAILKIANSAKLLEISKIRKELQEAAEERKKAEEKERRELEEAAKAPEEARQGAEASAEESAAEQVGQESSQTAEPDSGSQPADDKN